MHSSDIVIAAFAGAAVLLAVERAEAKDLLVAQPETLAYCALYAREATRIDIMHAAPVDTRLANTDYIVMLSKRIYRQCVANLPTLLPLPEEHRNLDTWAEDMRVLILSRAGTEPATGSEWAEACAAQWRTFDPSDGTVVRPASKGGKQECPLVRGPDGEWVLPD